MLIRLFARFKTHPSVTESKNKANSETKSSFTLRNMRDITKLLVSRN